MVYRLVDIVVSGLIYVFSTVLSSISSDIDSLDKCISLVLRWSIEMG